MYTATVSFFLLLAGFLGLLHVPPLSRLPALKTLRDKAAVALSLGFLVSGTLHFTSPARFVEMMPPWLPWHLGLVYLSGVFELLGAVGLLIRRTRRAAAWGLVALMICVFPANVHVALSGGSVEGLPTQRWYYWARLPFQIVYIAWALYCSRPPVDIR